MEIMNQEVLYGEEMVREVLVGMLQEMRPPPWCVRVLELPVGGKEGEGNAEAM